MYWWWVVHVASRLEWRINDQLVDSADKLSVDLDDGLDQLWGVSWMLWGWWQFERTWTHIHFHYMLLPVRLSVIRLSLCNVCAPYSAGWNFRQYFYAVWYLGHPLRSWKTLQSRDRSRATPPSGGFNARGSHIWRFWSFRRPYLRNGAR